MNTPPDLNALAAFASVVRHGSFRAAARERGVTPSALSHSVAKLERDLGVQLLLRSTRSVRMTDAGAAFFEGLQPALAAIADSFDAINETRQTPRGLVRITAPRLAAIGVLMDFLPEFGKSYPDVRIELRVEDAFEDFIAEGFDAGVRFGDALHPDVVATPIGAPFAMAVVASPAYLADSLPIREPNDLLRHQCIQIRLRSVDRVYEWEFERDGEKLALATRGALIVDDQEAAVRAAVAGMGVAYTTEPYVRAQLAAGALSPVLPDWQPCTEQFYLYTSRRRLLPASLRALVDSVKRYTARAMR